MVAEYEVGSEVGRLRKVIVHRPELSLMRLTPLRRARENWVIPASSRISRRSFMHPPSSNFAAINAVSRVSARRAEINFWD